MYPGPIHLLGINLATWDLAFLLGTVLGYCALRGAFKLLAAPPPPRWLGLRYAVIVYICAIAAQVFAYTFDSGTSFFPPPGRSVAGYYLSPVAGPKTLYGAILALPLAVGVAFYPHRNLRTIVAVDYATPALLIVLGFARIGCLLQGCCYGLRSRWGVAFPVGSSVHADQFLAGLVGIDQPSLAVLPTQLASAATCFLLALWSRRSLRNGDPDIFVRTIAAYSAFRFVVEFFRADAARNYAGPLSTSQWIAALILIAFFFRRSS